MPDGGFLDSNRWPRPSDGKRSRCVDASRGQEI
jgi:hypothetical protein